jgi:cephalosporin-C deacetylase-like acetyl esterase
MGYSRPIIFQRVIRLLPRCSKILTGIFMVVGFTQLAYAQDKNPAWPNQCKVVDIPSTKDGKIQPAYFFASHSGLSRPLVVSLHAWSSGYDEKDPLSWQCVHKNYNYIHPHFRGPNWTFEACGSPLVISDIEDAITYAIKHSNVDVNEIHIIGGSGGGYATLLAYMNTQHHVKSFSAWVPISNLIDWFYETKSREPKHSMDIAKAITGLDNIDDNYVINESEAKKRSPLFMTTPVQQRIKSKLYIYAGVHDGYTGSVPITHSINIYNKVVRDFNTNEKDALVNDDTIIKLLTYRGAQSTSNDSIGGRRIIYQTKYKDKTQLIIFEGGHESLSNVALNHIK